VSSMQVAQDYLIRTALSLPPASNARKPNHRRWDLDHKLPNGLRYAGVEANHSMVTPTFTVRNRPHVCAC